MLTKAPVTVVEMPEFLSKTRKLIDEETKTALIGYLAYNPTAGDLIPGTGGVRKLRWALEGRGKRGGARIIYFYYNETLPLFALSAYAKNDQADLTQQDRNDLQQFTKQLTEQYKRKKQ